MSTTPKSNRTTHTPGPWTVGDEDENFQVLVEGPQFSICHCHHHCVGTIELEMRANAQLISAAPELLEACRDLREIVLNGMTSDHDDIVDALKRARAAIAKAEGR